MMNGLLTISNFLLIIALIIIIALWRKYIPSYLVEKGKNVVTKEDIKVITEGVEAVKAEYSRSVEEFKNALATELELSKISHAELQIHKTEQFVKLIPEKSVKMVFSLPPERRIYL